LTKNYDVPQVAQVTSVFVPQSHVDTYLERLLEIAMPMYKATTSVSAIMVLRRSLVAYEEVITITTWQSIEKMKGFQTDFPIKELVPGAVLIQREPPHLYQVVVDACRSRDGDP
jgi:hypothetical protein